MVRNFLAALLLILIIAIVYTFPITVLVIGTIIALLVPKGNPALTPMENTLKVIEEEKAKYKAK